MSEHKCPAERLRCYPNMAPTHVDDNSPCHGDGRCFTGPADRRKKEALTLPSTGGRAYYNGSHWVKDRRAQPKEPEPASLECFGGHVPEPEPEGLEQFHYRNYTGTEYRRGRFSLFITQHEDGHVYVEIHRCSPQDFQEPCTEAEISAAIKAFLALEVER